MVSLRNLSLYQPVHMLELWKQYAKYVLPCLTQWKSHVRTQTVTEQSMPLRAEGKTWSVYTCKDTWYKNRQLVTIF